MAATFTVVGTEPTIERLSPSRTRPIKIVTAIANESGAMFWIKVLPVNYNATYLNQRLAVIAERMDTLAAKPGVIGVRVLEDTDPSDRFIQVVEVVVESTSGNSFDDVLLSWTEAQGAAGYAKVAARRKQLDATEAL